MVIDTFTDERRFAPDMEETLRKIQVEPEGPESGTVVVTAHLKDGRALSEEFGQFKGSAGNPMSRDERMEKVWDCVGRVLSDSDTRRLLSLMEDLEDVADISEAMEIIGGRPSEE